MDTTVGWRKETGQALIQVTLSLVVLLGFVALAIDVGRVYAERRNMQNAADAAALAGARELCLGHSPSTAIAKGEEVLRANGVAAGAAAGAVTVSGNIVTAVGKFLDLNPIVGQLVAWEAIEEVNARAKAACGAATSACGLWPVAVSAQAWDQLSFIGSTCVERVIAVWNGDENDENCAQKGTCMSSKPPAPYCEPTTGNRTANLCDCYDCSALQFGGQPVYLMATEGRAWLDFSSAVEPGDSITPECQKTGNGSDELKCQLLRNSSIKINLPKCVDEIEGVRASTKKPIEARAKSKDDYVKIPLFDNTCDSKKDRFHISSFGCASVVDWTTVSDLVTGKGKKEVLPQAKYADMGYQPIKGSEKLILVKVDCDNKCQTACGSTDGTQAEANQVQAVSLIE